MEWSEFSFILDASPLGGIGVFATHDISEGEQIFRTPFVPRVLKKKEVPNQFLKYCIFINEDEVVCPKHFDCMEIGWFINHSDEPNIARTNAAESNNKITSEKVLDSFKTGSLIVVKKITAGDEILINYNGFNEPEHLKGNYFKLNS